MGRSAVQRGFLVLCFLNSNLDVFSIIYSFKCNILIWILDCSKTVSCFWKCFVQIMNSVFVERRINFIYLQSLDLIYIYIYTHTHTQCRRNSEIIQTKRILYYIQRKNINRHFGRGKR